MKIKEEIIVEEVLEWLEKLKRLESDATKVLHVRNLLSKALSQQKQEIDNWYKLRDKTNNLTADNSQNKN